MTKNFEEKAQEKKNLKPPEFFKKPREMVLAPEINSPDIPATREQEEALSFSHHLSRSPNQTNQTTKPTNQTNKKSRGHTWVQSLHQNHHEFSKDGAYSRGITCIYLSNSCDFVQNIHYYTQSGGDNLHSQVGVEFHLAQ